MLHVLSIAANLEGDLMQARRALDEALKLLRANGDLAVEGATLGLVSMRTPR